MAITACPSPAAPECLGVSILDDSELENTQESFRVTLVASPGSEDLVDIGTAVVEVNIEDNDRGELCVGVESEWVESSRWSHVGGVWVGSVEI